MKTYTFFCPFCWEQIKEKDLVCPYCYKSLTEYAEKSYEEKLIISLKHPIKEIRRNIVFILGKKKSELAISYLEDIVFNEKDYLIVIEAIKALKQIDTKEAIKILAKAEVEHPSALIRKFVKNYLK